MDYVVVLDNNIVYLVCDHGFAWVSFSSADIAGEFSKFNEGKIKNRPRGKGR